LFHGIVLHGAESKKGWWVGEARESLPSISHAVLEKSGIIVRDLTDAALPNVNPFPTVGVGLA
jgi:hypothetical protein